MAQIRFANNVSTQLTKPVTADDSTIEVRSLTHGLVWPNISATGDYFLIVIDDIESSYWEILKCTKVSIADNITTLTVERGLEGTAPSEFQAGSVVENRLTAGTLDAFGAGFPTKVEIDRGGTGATTSADARTNLDVPSKADLSSEVNTRTSEVARLDQKIIDNIPPAATTSVRGTTTLSSAIDSVSEAMAATPKAVKTAYDAAISAKSDVDTVDARVTDEVNTLTANIEAVQSSCAPTSHASSSTTYGLATDTSYGHVRSDGDTTNIVTGEVIVKDVAIGGNVADLASKRGQLGNVTIWSSITDFDTYTTQGVFGGFWGASANNSPTSYTCVGFIEVLSNRDSGRLAQRVHCLQVASKKPLIAERTYHTDYGWTSWVQIIDSTNLATISTPGLVKPGTGTSVAGDGTLNVDIASTSQKGIVQLSSSVSSTSEAYAATPKAVKTAYDKAVAAFNATDIVGEYKIAHLTKISGYLLCDGAAVSRTTYADLFAKIGTTFGIGDGSTTFNLPDFRNKTFWGAKSNLGTTLAAGLPNFSGKFWAYTVGWSDASGNGPFYNAGKASSAGNAGGEGGNACTWGFDPSRVSSVYGSSTTVQPPAIAVNIFIKY